MKQSFKSCLHTLFKEGYLPEIQAQDRIYYYLFKDQFWLLWYVYILKTKLAQPDVLCWWEIAGDHSQ